MESVWAILNLYTARWEPIDAATAASVCVEGFTVRLMDSAEVEGVQ